MAYEVLTIMLRYLNEE